MAVSTPNDINTAANLDKRKKEFHWFKLINQGLNLELIKIIIIVSEKCFLFVDLILHNNALSQKFSEFIPFFLHS